MPYTLIGIYDEYHIVGNVVSSLQNESIDSVSVIGQAKENLPTKLRILPDQEVDIAVDQPYTDSLTASTLIAGLGIRQFKLSDPGNLIIGGPIGDIISSSENLNNQRSQDLYNSLKKINLGQHLDYYFQKIIDGHILIIVHNIPQSQTSKISQIMTQFNVLDLNIIKTPPL